MSLSEKALKTTDFSAKDFTKSFEKFRRALLSMN